MKYVSTKRRIEEIQSSHCLLIISVKKVLFTGTSRRRRKREGGEKTIQSSRNLQPGPELCGSSSELRLAGCAPRGGLRPGRGPRRGLALSRGAGSTLRAEPWAWHAPQRRRHPSSRHPHARGCQFAAPPSGSGTRHPAPGTFSARGTDRGRGQGSRLV